MSFIEMIDLVSQDDSTVISTIPKQQLYQTKRCNFRVINGFVINQDNKLWIPTRSASKTLFPSCLDCSVGGHVQSGESYFAAFVRESKEELRLDPEQLPHQLLMKLSPYSDGTSAFMHVYALYFNAEVPFNPDDFSSGEWLLPKHALAKITQGHPAKSDLPILLQRYICL